MPNQQPNIRSFSKRLWLASGRDQVPQGAMRRCSGAAQDPGESVYSRYGSSLLYPIGDVISLTKYNQVQYQYDGSTLYQAGFVKDTGYNGGRLTFVNAPPQEGVPDYMFLTGGGKLKKLDPNGILTNWGIQNPPSQMQGALGAQNLLNIDTFNGSASAWATTSNCTVANESTIVYSGGGSLKITPSAGPWSITKNVATFQMAFYPNTLVSLPTDYISLWVYVKQPNNVVWLWLLFDVNDGTFQTDYYRAVIQIVPTTANVHAANADVIISADADRWFQVAIAKSQFFRVGSTLNLDWSNVQKIRIEGGDPSQATGPPIYVDQFQMFGGFGLGTGPAALTGGSTLQYLVTFGNSTTGNDSNPCDAPVQVPGVAEQPVLLSNIPVSTDPQVSNRKLWRTSEGGGTFFYLDTIYDNTTTTYEDTFSSIPGQPITLTTWQPSAAVLSGYIIDTGTGYLATCSTSGTTGSGRPNFSVPTSVWSPLSVFDSIADTILPYNSENAFQIDGIGTTGKTQPNWASAPNPGQLIGDGTVVWKNIGQPTTADGTAVWKTLGLNALNTLGAQEVFYDNTVFPPTTNDAIYFQGSMWVTRDTNPGSEGYVYISPPGRAEGYGNILNVGTTDDPCQKLVVWDEQLFVFTTKYIYPLSGSYPAIAIDDHIQGALGTTAPFSVAQTPFGIVYQSSEDIRIFSRAVNEALGFQALAPIERGQVAENVAPFVALIAEHTKDEVILSNGQVSFGFYFPAQTWRMLGVGLNAIYYEDDTGIIQAATSGAVLNFENQDVYTDNGIPIQVEWQTPGILLNEGQKALTQRVFIDVDCNGQSLTPTLLVDEALSPNFYTMPAITNMGRGTIEIPFQKSAKIFSVRLTGNPIQRVTFYGIAVDIAPSMP